MLQGEWVIKINKFFNISQHDCLHFCSNCVLFCNQSRSIFQTYLWYKQDVVEVSKRVFGSENYRVAMSLINLGKFLSGCAHNYSEAILVFTEALRIQHKGAKGQMNTTFASTLNHMGKAYELRSRIGDLDRAEKCYLQAAKVFRYSMIPSDDHEVINVLCNLYHVRELLSQKKTSIKNECDEEINSIIQPNQILEKISEESRDDDDKQFPTRAPYRNWASFCFSTS